MLVMMILMVMIMIIDYFDDDDGYDDPNGEDDDDADDDVDGHLLGGEKSLDSHLLSSPASKPYFAISEIIKMIMMPYIG